MSLKSTLISEYRVPFNTLHLIFSQFFNIYFIECLIKIQFLNFSRGDKVSPSPYFRWKILFTDDDDNNNNKYIY